VAVQRDYLAPSNPNTRETVVLDLPRMFSVYDLRTRQLLGNTDRLELELGPMEPVLLSLSEKPIAPPSIAGRVGHISAKLPNSRFDRTHRWNMASFTSMSPTPRAVRLRIIPKTCSSTGR